MFKTRLLRLPVRYTQTGRFDPRNDREKNSSNGKMLYEYCKSINPVTYWISESDDVDKQWFEGYKSIGISGATSTSREQLESVMARVKNLTSS